MPSTNNLNNRPSVQGGPSIPASEIENLNYAWSANVLLIAAGYNIDDIAECWMQANGYHDAPVPLEFSLTRRWRPDPEMASQPLLDKQHGTMQFVPVQLSYDDRNPDRLILQGYLAEELQLEAPLILTEENLDADPADSLNGLRFCRLEQPILKGSFMKLFFDTCSGTGYIHYIVLCDTGLQLEPAIPDDSIFSDDPDHIPYCPDCCTPIVDEEMILGSNPATPAAEPSADGNTPPSDSTDPFNTDPT